MGAAVILSHPILTVEPGGGASLDVHVRNAGAGEDEFVVDVLGEAKPFAAIEPSRMTLAPGADAAARITFRPPKTTNARAGEIQYSIRVWSRFDPNGTIVQQGVLHIAAFVSVTATITPH